MQEKDGHEERDEIVTEYVVRQLSREIETGKKQIDIAKEAQISASSISQMMAGKYGVGRKVGTSIARYLGFRSFDGLRRAAYQDWYTARPEYRHESLREVATHPKHRGRWSEESIAAVKARAWKLEVDPGREHWIELLDRVNAALGLADLPLPRDRH